MDKEIQEKLEQIDKRLTIIALSVESVETALKRFAANLNGLSLQVGNLALQTTNNQVENRKSLDAIKTGVLETNLAVKYPAK